MTTNGLNTLEYAERLMRAGVPEEHAKAQAMVLYEIINSTLATKRDIEELRLASKRDIKELDTKIETIRAELKKDIKTLDEKISLRINAASAAAVVTILGCLVTLGKLGLLAPAAN